MIDGPIFFSCIVTCYNREDVISRSIQSILNQTFQNFEIIVVDDASKDQSVAEILKINDPRIKLVRNHVNGGQNYSINAGIAAAQYDYLAFLDSDDEWLPEYLEEMRKTYLAHPSISFAYTNFAEGVFLTLEGDKKYAEVLDQGYLSSMISITAKKDAVENTGRFDIRYTICQDDDFCFRLAKKYSFKVIPQKLVQIHTSTNSVSNDKLKSAEGWEFLFKNYKADIILYCGNRTLSKHTIDLSLRFFQCKKYRKGTYYYFISLSNFLKGNGNKKFDYPLADFVQVSAAIMKSILVNFKQKLFKPWLKK